MYLLLINFLSFYSFILLIMWFLCPNFVSRSNWCLFCLTKRSQLHTAQQSLGVEAVRFFFFFNEISELFIFFVLKYLVILTSKKWNLNHWKMHILLIRNKRAKPIIIDPGLYKLNKSEIWWVIKQRSLPTAFKLYTGFSPIFFLFNIWKNYIASMLHKLMA